MALLLHCEVLLHLTKWRYITYLNPHDKSNVRERFLESEFLRRPGTHQVFRVSMSLHMWFPSLKRCSLPC